METCEQSCIVNSMKACIPNNFYTISKQLFIRLVSTKLRLILKKVIPEKKEEKMVVFLYEKGIILPAQTQAWQSGSS